MTHRHGARRQELLVFTAPSFMHERAQDGEQTQTEGSDGSKERGKKFGHEAEDKKELRCKGRPRQADGFYSFYVSVSGWAITAGVTAQLQVGRVCVRS